MSRRRFLGTAAAGVAGVTRAVVRPSAARAQGAKEVVYAGFGGSFQEAVNKAWLEPFEQGTGIKVRVTTFDLGKLSAMVQTGNVEWDVVDIAGSYLGLGYAKNLFEPLDYSIIDANGVGDKLRGRYAIAYTHYATTLGWSTRTYSGSKAPSSWADYWDQKKFPGPRALRKTPHNTLEFALLADGVPKDRLYPLDVDRAFRKLDQIKPYVKVWWTSGQQPIQLLSDGEVEMAEAFNSRLAIAKKEGARLDFTFNQGSLASTWYIVPRGTPRRENAMRLIAYILTPRINARITEQIPSAPANAKAYQYIRSEIVPELVSAPQNAEKMVLLDEAGFWAQNFDALKKRFDEWVVA